MRKAIAIDFDGCMCDWAWPGIGAPHMNVIQAAIREKQNGTALILWTCRVGERLGEAVKFCSDLGLTFDAVNGNLPERIAAYQNDPRKVEADEYWDDRAVLTPIDPAFKVDGMPLAEIIDSLEDQAQDRDSLTPPDEPDSIFIHDAAALRAAVKLLRRLEETNHD